MFLPKISKLIKIGKENVDINGLAFYTLGKHRKSLNDNILITNKSFSPNEYEEKIIRKVFEWPKIIESASFKFEPHKIPFYLYELSTLFHSYWKNLSIQKLYLYKYQPLK